MSDWKILEGDALEMLRTLPDESVDAVITDPPYELAFMGKRWDRAGVSFRVETWEAVIRVMKPGAHLLAFGGTRTYHRLVCAIEDAGFEIRDSIHWIYGTGFPKSLDVGKALDEMAFQEWLKDDPGRAKKYQEQLLQAKGDTEAVEHIRRKFRKRAGLDRQIIGRKTGRSATPVEDIRGGRYMAGEAGAIDCSAITAPATEAAKQWEGWGTALKPGHEPIVVARKPLEGTVAQNVQKWGTGGINVDACRVAGVKPQVTQGINSNPTSFAVAKERRISGDPDTGRWPPNVLLDESAAAELDRQSGITQSGAMRKQVNEYPGESRTAFLRGKSGPNNQRRDSGGASRFFPIFRYEAKASRSERDAGLEGFEELSGGELTDRKDGSAGLQSPRAGAGRTSGGRNLHPTVKPVALMQWLCRLVTPPGGTVLDPFTGSGSTGIAAGREGFRFVGIDDDPRYVELATRRIE